MARDTARNWHLIRSVIKTLGRLVHKTQKPYLIQVWPIPHLRFLHSPSYFFATIYDYIMLFIYFRLYCLFSLLRCCNMIISLVGPIKFLPTCLPNYPFIWKRRSMILCTSLPFLVFALVCFWALNLLQCVKTAINKTWFSFSGSGSNCRQICRSTKIALIWLTKKEKKTNPIQNPSCAIAVASWHKLQILLLNPLFKQVFLIEIEISFLRDTCVQRHMQKCKTSFTCDHSLRKTCKRYNLLI